MDKQKHKKYIVIDASVAGTEKRFRGLAAKYVEWELQNSGAIIASEAKDADIILVTVVSPHEYKCVPRALKRVGVQPLREKRNKQQMVILGGQGAMSPIVFDPYVDMTCVGEGRNFIRTLVMQGADKARSLHNTWIPGESREVVPDNDFPWDAPPVMAEDGIVRIFASRSCKKKMSILSHRVGDHLQGERCGIFKKSI